MFLLVFDAKVEIGGIAKVSNSVNLLPVSVKFIKKW